MIRHKFLTAIIAAAALTLGACGSTSGTATTQDSSVSSSSVESSPESASSEPSSATESAADASADAASVTVGDGTLDAQSSAWFNTACTGMQPLGGMVAAVMGVAMGAAGATGTDSATPDVAAMQGQLVSALDSAGTALNDTADKLADTPPPTFAKGDQMAKDFITFLKATGPKLTAVADKVKAAAVTDAASLGAALSQIQSLSTSDLDGANPLSGYDLDPATEKAVQELPACKAMQDSLGGMMGTGSAG